MVLPIGNDKVGLLGYITSENRQMLRPHAMHIMDEIQSLQVTLTSSPHPSI